MKNVWILILLFSVQLSAQSKITRSVSYILDKYENKWQHRGGDVETIRFVALKRVTEKDSSVTMQLTVTNKDWEKTSVTQGIAVAGNGGVAIGGGSIETVEKKVGFIIFSKIEATELFKFENEMYLKSISGDDFEKETTWTLNIGDRFISSVIYNGNNKWVHIWTLDGASFEIPETELLPMFRKLSVISGIID